MVRISGKIDIEKIKDTNSMFDNIMNNIKIKNSFGIDDLIKKSLEKIGINYKEESVSNNLIFISSVDNNFNHLYYKYGTKEEIRILSYEKFPTLTQDYIDNKYVIKSEIKYY
jgi:hypothetical protein